MLPRSIEEAKAWFKNGKMSPSDLVSAYLQNIEKDNKRLSIYLEVFED
jgi:Asp-tRNA(Asn)/Glu-tRNA(Gln) amidotransferase A subunit family amidase